MRMLPRSWLTGLAAMMKIHVFMENPTGSTVFKFDVLRDSLSMAGARYVHTWLGGFGQRSLKPTTLFISHPARFTKMISTTRSWAVTCVQAIGKEPLSRVTPKSRNAVRKKSGMNKAGWISGSRSQKSSQVYPRAFCKAMGEIVLATIRSASRVDRQGNPSLESCKRALRPS